MTKWIVALVILALPAGVALAKDENDRQRAEGFNEIEFHHDASGKGTRDFRGTARGYMTAGWWAPGQMKENYVSWRTAAVPEKKATTFAFIGSTAVVPPEFSRGPSAKLSVNGNYALTFSIGWREDKTWKEGDYELKYTSKRVEFPYGGGWRQYREMPSNSGIYELTVPASVLEAGKPALLKVEMVPFDRWNNGWFMVKEHRDVLKQSMEILEGEIESLRRDVGALNQMTHTLATQVYRDHIDAGRFQHQIIYTNGYRHLHPADVVRLQNGDILLFTREGTEHIANDGDVIMVRSTDGGKTWGGREVVSAIKDLDEREGCGIQLKDGTIVVGIYYNNLYGPEGAYKRNLDKLTTVEDGRRGLGAHIVTSKDNGKTWSKPHFIDTKGMPFKDLEGPTDAPIEMPDGSIVMGVIAYALDGDPKNLAAVMLKSSDQGQTWQYLSTIAPDPGGKLGGFMEPGIVRTKSGRIVAGLRNHGPDQALWTTYSDDDGKTWEPVKKSDMIGHPADLIQLSDGRLMASYGIRPEHARPGGIRACFSSDNGATWDIRTEVQLRNDFFNMDVGYPESMQMPDGSVLTVYYYNLFGRYFIGGTFWKP